jgi:predicted MFS family arabinose efflux permease
VLWRLPAGVAATLRGLRGEGRGSLLVAVAGGWFFVLGLRFVVPALLPFITDDFTVSNATAGAAITVLWLAYGLVQFPAGALADRFGERLLLVASALVAVVGLAGFAAAPTFGVFLVATAAFGLGTGLFGPPRGMVLSRTFSAREGAAFGAVIAAGSVGAALLPPAATVVAVRFGWRAAIGVAIPGFVLVATLLWWAVPSPEGDGDAGTDPGGAARGGTEEAAAPTAGGPEASPGAPSTATAVRRAIATREVALAVLAVTLVLFTFQGLSAFYTTYLVEQKGLSEAVAGGLFGLLFLAGAVTQTVGGTLADRLGYGRVLAAVTLASVPPLLALPFLSGVVPLALATAVLSLRLAVSPPTNAYVLAALPASIRGTAWGFVRSALFAVGAFGSLGVGALADADLFAEAFLLLGALTALAGVLYLFLPARTAD